MNIQLTSKAESMVRRQMETGSIATPEEVVERALGVLDPPRSTLESLRLGEGLQRCAGALAASWTDEDDQILAELQHARSQVTHREFR